MLLLSGFGKEIECALCSARAMQLKKFHASLAVACPHRPGLGLAPYTWLG
jgi:hypothetical protein